MALRHQQHTLRLCGIRGRHNGSCAWPPIIRTRCNCPRNRTATRRCQSRCRAADRQLYKLLCLLALPCLALGPVNNISAKVLQLACCLFVSLVVVAVTSCCCCCFVAWHTSLSPVFFLSYASRALSLCLLSVVGLLCFSRFSIHASLTS